VGTAGLILRGTIVTDTQAPFAGEVFVQGDTIMCVAASCAATSGASAATIVDTAGIVMPGLIDTHNHILFDIFDETDWSPSHGYTNHNQWSSDDPKYTALVDAKQYMNGEGSSVDFGCAMDKYGELKGIIAGTTSILGAANPSNRKCYGSLARTIDQTPNGLPADKMQVATLFPSTSAADGVCDNFTSGKTTAYVIHDGEGIDATAEAEFGKLNTISTVDGCLYSHQTTIVHGAAFNDADFTTMAQHQMSLVWSPKSNVFLYGAGTNLAATANVPLALSKGINIALAPDWSIGGSINLLDELRFAKVVSDSIWSGLLTEQQLFQMVTINAAKALALDATIGSLTVGKKADIMVISGDAGAPYDALLAATPREVRLVMVGGVVLYGDSPLQSLGPAAPGCEPLDVCCTDKFACVATTTTTDELNQTYAEFRQSLVDGLAAYDAMHVSPYTWSPIAPLTKCP
jgi:cytosine/adenosine deaminase-related metal-dependent hydrolase